MAFLCTAGPYTLSAGQNFVPKLWETKTGKLVARFPWLGDPHFYAARYGFPFATAVVSARRDLLVTMKENLAQVWRISFAPGSRAGFYLGRGTAMNAGREGRQPMRGGGISEIKITITSKIKRGNHNSGS